MTFTVELGQASYLARDGKTFIMEAGPVQVLVGSASDDIRVCDEFEVLSERAEFGRDRPHLTASSVR